MFHYLKQNIQMLYNPKPYNNYLRPLGTSSNICFDICPFSPLHIILRIKPQKTKVEKITFQTEESKPQKLKPVKPSLVFGSYVEEIKALRRATAPNNTTKEKQNREKRSQNGGLRLCDEQLRNRASLRRNCSFVPVSWPRSGPKTEDSNCDSAEATHPPNMIIPLSHP